MKKAVLFCTLTALLSTCLFGCSSDKTPKIGVSLGVGSAPRWAQEKIYMEDRAEELGAKIEVHLSEMSEGESQMEDCISLINSGIDVLIMRPKDTEGIEDVIELAKKKNVKIINYAGLVDQQPIDLFVGYDCRQIGQTLGQYLSEMVTEGNYIILSGPPEDKYVSSFIYDGAMEFIDPIRDDINIILDESVPGWSPDEAKTMVHDAISQNENKIDAILAPNDGIAGACAEVIKELGITSKVVITGMDAQLEAAQRIVAGTQSCTIFMNGQFLANTAVEEACKLAKGEKISVNAEIDNGSDNPVPANLINKSNVIPANLISGQLVTKENLDKKLIDSNYFTHEEVYGKD